MHSMVGSLSKQGCSSFVHKDCCTLLDPSEGSADQEKRPTFIRGKGCDPPNQSYLGGGGVGDREGDRFLNVPALYNRGVYLLHVG